MAPLVPSYLLPKDARRCHNGEEEAWGHDEEANLRMR